MLTLDFGCAANLTCAVRDLCINKSKADLFERLLGFWFERTGNRLLDLSDLSGALGRKDAFEFDIFHGIGVVVPDRYVRYSDGVVPSFLPDLLDQLEGVR